MGAVLTKSASSIALGTSERAQKLMVTIYKSAADAEDAYYDAIDESDLDKMMSVWDDSPEIACLLPMRPLHQGTEAVRALLTPIFDPEHKIEISIHHLQWSEHHGIAIHLLEEVVTLVAEGESQPPIYASNIYRLTDNGWRMLMHLNSPAPPPGALPPLGDA